MPKPLKEQLTELRDQNNPAGVLDLIFETLKSQDHEKDEAQQLEDFWNETKSDAKYTYFLLDVMDVYVDKLLDTVHRYGIKFEETKKMIKDGKLPELRLFMDDDKTIDKITHDILFMHENEFSQFDLFSRNINQVFRKGIKRPVKNEDLQEGNNNNKIFDFEDDDIVEDEKKDNIIAPNADNNVIAPKKPKHEVDHDFLHDLGVEFLIDGKNALDVLQDKLHAKRKVKAEEFGISEEKLYNYQMIMNDPDMNRLGFNIKEHKPAEGESYFDSIPKHIQRLNNSRTPDELDDYEDEIFDKADDYNAFARFCHSAVELYEHLYKKFQNIEKQLQSNNALSHLVSSEDFGDMMTNLEKATHLGKDYVFRDPSIQDAKPTDKYSPADVGNAITWIGNSPDKVYDQVDEKIQSLAKEGYTDGKNIDLLYDLKDTAADLCNLNVLLRKKNKAFDKKDTRSHYVDDAKKLQKFIEKDRNHKGFITHSNFIRSNYTRTLDEQMDNLSKSVMNDLVNTGEYNEEYDKLF